ncbi:recombinase family protein [Streptomyces sp. NPDC051561]|uniref:recombinase family protein n=1 Tax=Streptomyces sp. NPDC051561 TaxID=3365658 RepID=UPI0037AABE76
MITVGAYVRMSQDDDLGSPEQRREGVLRQAEDCAALARERGLLMGKVYEDNDTSAFKERRHRPAFEELLHDLADGVVDGVIVYALDRVARQPLDLERLIEVYDLSRRPLVFASCVEAFCLSDEEGQMAARHQVLVALAESQNMSRRIARVNKARAATGKAHLGGRRPFGWQQGGARVDPTEAGLIRKAYADLLGGALIGHIRADWIAQGLRPRTRETSEGRPRPLSHGTVLSRLVNPRLCGYRAYAPQTFRESERRALWLPDHLVRAASGEPVTGDWETIVTVEEWEQVTALLHQRKQDRAMPPRSTAPSHLLSGIARCGNCGAAMYPTDYVKGTPAHSRHGFRYCCLPSNGGCGSCSRVGPSTDTVVEAALLSRLHQSLHEPYPQFAPGVYGQLRTSLRTRTHLGEARQRGELTAADLHARLDALRVHNAPHLVELHSSMAGHRRTLARFGEAAERWDDLDVQQKRALLRETATHVVIRPAGRGKRFDPDKIEVTWPSGPTLDTDRAWQSKSTLKPISLISDSMAG